MILGIGLPFIGIKSDFVVVLIVPYGALTIGFFESNIIIFGLSSLTALGTLNLSSIVGSKLDVSRSLIKSLKFNLGLLFF